MNLTQTKIQKLLEHRWSTNVQARFCVDCGHFQFRREL